MLAACLDQARAASGVERLVLFGICQGGTLSTCVITSYSIHYTKLYEWILRW